jgi:hypothetical protein
MYVREQKGHGRYTGDRYTSVTTGNGSRNSRHVAFVFMQ